MLPKRTRKDSPGRVGETLSLDLARRGILYAGSKVFSRLGYATARVEDILLEAGIARRTFYRHFRNKEDVLAAIYEYATGELIAAVRASGEPPDPVRALHRAIDIYFDYCAENRPLAAILVPHAMQAGSPLATHRQRFRDQLIALADEAVRTNTGQRNDPMLHVALLSAIEGVSVELLASEADARHIARAKSVVHLLVDRALQLPAARR